MLVAVRSAARWRVLLTVGARGGGGLGPGRQLAQAHGAVQRLLVAAGVQVAQCERGHAARARGDVRPPSASERHCRRRPALFATRFLSAGGGGAAQRQSRPASARPPRTALIYVPYIKRVFRVPLWIFLASYFTYGPTDRPPPRPRPAFRSRTQDRLDSTAPRTNKTISIRY